MCGIKNRKKIIIPGPGRGEMGTVPEKKQERDLFGSRPKGTMGLGFQNSPSALRGGPGAPKIPSEL